MNNHPLVSIITPTYNHERFIEQCIESVLAQTYPYWEMIIIDDCSTDRTGEIVARYKDERIKYIRQDNLGIWRLSETYNKALEISQGELIAVLEGDDFWPPNKLEKQVPVFERQEIVLSWGRRGIVNDRGEIMTIGLRSLKRFIKKSREDVLRELLLGDFIPACTAVCRKDALVSIGGFKQPQYMPVVDYPTWLELSLQGKFYPIDEVMGYWRRHKEQVTTIRSTTMAQASKVSMDFLEHLPLELKKAIGVSTSDLLAEHEARIANAFFLSGRIALTKGEWKEATKNFKKALRGGRSLKRLHAIVGLICARCRIDLEWVATITRRPRLRGSCGEWDTTLSYEHKLLPLAKIQISGYKYVLCIFDLIDSVKRALIYRLRGGRRWR